MACKNVVGESAVTKDTLFYCLFPFNSDWTSITDELQLENLISEYMAHIYLDVKDYIWSSEPFSLSVFSHCSEDSLSSRPHIRGKMVVEGYLEDEWFVFYLLSKLTKVYPTLICRVYDSDGEFPLIEAAHELPRWAHDSGAAENRVFIRDGVLHLVPPSVLPVPSDTLHTPDPEITMTALGRVVQAPSATLASPAIQNAISLKIEEYPRKISKEHHSTHAFVPVGVAALLQEYPTLVSAAVGAFCDRDILDNKCLRVMKHFPPETRVMTSVRFSKALYARLSSSLYTPDRRTGWNIPSEEKNDTYNFHVIGMKLACGFEILVCSAGGITPSISTPVEVEDVMEQNLTINPKWIKYKESLMKNGYFRGEMEGSKLFSELEANARKFFVSNQMLTSRKGSAVDEHLSIGSIIVKLMSKIDADYEAFKRKEKTLLPPDDENWMTIDPDEFDQMLESKFQPNGNKIKLADNLNTFFNYASSFEGAEIPEELRPKPPFRNQSTNEEKSRKISSGSNTRKISNRLHHPQFRKISNHSNASDSSEMSSFSAKIDFNAEAFTDALNNITEYSLPEDEYFNGAEEGSSGMSSYEDDDENEVSLNSRKTSNESKASSGIEVDVVQSSAQPPPPQRPPRRKKKKSSERKIPLAEFDAWDDVSDDDEGQPIADLIKAFKEECGLGPTTSLFASLSVSETKD